MTFIGTTLERQKIKGKLWKFTEKSKKTFEIYLNINGTSKKNLQKNTANQRKIKGNQRNLKPKEHLRKSMENQ